MKSVHPMGNKAPMEIIYMYMITDFFIAHASQHAISNISEYIWYRKAFHMFYKFRHTTIS